jgi:hypothetical protein
VFGAYTVEPGFLLSAAFKGGLYDPSKLPEDLLTEFHPVPASVPVIVAPSIRCSGTDREQSITYITLPGDKPMCQSSLMLKPTGCTSRLRWKRHRPSRAMLSPTLGPTVCRSSTPVASGRLVVDFRLPRTTTSCLQSFHHDSEAAMKYLYLVYDDEKKLDTS